MGKFLQDAVIFHNKLNPVLFDPESGEMHAEIRETLLRIADDFKEFLGLDDLQLLDIRLTGSNAAYTYTPHSDVDLHLIVDIPKDLDLMYTELFNAKKNLYNITRHIVIKGFDVELYVESSKTPATSMGVFSVMKGEWIDYPKRVRARVDDMSVLSKVDAYTTRIREALASDDVELVKQVYQDFRDMRQAGLEQGGEFSPENLAFKILRTRGLAKELFDHIINLKDNELSLESLEEESFFVEGRTPKVGWVPVRKSDQKIAWNLAVARNGHCAWVNEEWEWRKFAGDKLLPPGAKWP